MQILLQYRLVPQKPFLITQIVIVIQIGYRLVDFPQRELDQLADHIGQKFNFSDRLKRRISNKKKLQTLEQLIER